MLKGARSSGDKNFAAQPGSRRSGALGGMVIGQLLGFGIAFLLGASVPSLLAAILIGGAVGGMKRTQPKSRKAAPRRDKRIRAYVFEALAETSKKLDEMIIDEEFNGAASAGESDRRAMKTAPAPKLAVAPPAPPKMGGM